MTAFRPSSSGFGFALKRLFDIITSLALLIILSPLLIIIAILIRVTEGAPILYAWRVVGKNGKPFVGYKFRTMVLNADAQKEKLRAQNEMRGPVFKIKDDPRVTRIGKILRRYSLDELPQLWSVLIGTMSMVGPRPPLQSEYVKFSDWQKKKLAMKPGMTSLWQIRGKPQDFDDWVKLDLEYIEHWSLGLDVKILFETFLVVVRGKNY
ncbi:MAG: sugar transferase [Chloroflexi bacterium]|nr:sugar transferase [Chloroflexota bacterium]